MQLWNGATNALNQLRDVEQMSFQFVSEWIQPVKCLQLAAQQVDCSRYEVLGRQSLQRVHDTLKVLLHYFEKLEFSNCVDFHCHWRWHGRIQVWVNGPDTCWCLGENQRHINHNVLLTGSYCLSCVRSLASLLSSSKTKHRHTKHVRQSALWNGIHLRW